MELTFLGSDAGFGDKNNSAYVEVDDNLILIDCGITVFNIIKHKFDFNKYKNVSVIITHLHNDHAGSLSQFILYLWFVHKMKTNVITACENIEEYLRITGTPDEAYNLIRETENIKFVETIHAKELDCYGVILTINGKRIVYTGDTNTLEPFIKYINEADELYVDTSRYGGVHLKFEDVFEKLKSFKQNGIKVYLMHLDDRKYITEINNGEFEIV